MRLESTVIFVSSKDHINSISSFSAAQQNVLHTLCCHCRIMQEDVANKVSERKLIVKKEVYVFRAYPGRLESPQAVCHNLIKHKKRSKDVTSLTSSCRSLCNRLPGVMCCCGKGHPEWVVSSV